jgi:GDPmannose 4,6-dehydratase
MKRALIFGISGQDGAYLARLLLSKRYEVYGTSRDAESRDMAGLKAVGILEQVRLCSASLLDFRNLLQVITQVSPDEIYNLAGQSSVGLSFSQPIETMESTALGPMQILEVMRYLQSRARFYNAASSECFGEVPEGQACDESTPFHPRSPYATAKAAAFHATTNYREAYGLYACSGILFNHESELRPKRFVTRKIVSTAVRIARGDESFLELGNRDVWRDWGYAPEYVEAMWLMLQQEKPEDYVVATGEAHSLQEFVERVFAELSLDWKKHLKTDLKLFRPSDLIYVRGNPAKALVQLGWQAKTKFDQLIPKLLEAELKSTH